MRGRLASQRFCWEAASLRNLGKPRFPKLRNLAMYCGLWGTGGGAVGCLALTLGGAGRSAPPLPFARRPKGKGKVKGKTSGLCPEPCQGASPPGPRSGFSLWRCLSPTPPLGTSPAAWVSAPPVRSPPAGQYSWGAFPGRAPGPLPSSRSTGGLYQTGTSSSAHPPNPE